KSTAETPHYPHTSRCAVIVADLKMDFLTRKQRKMTDLQTQTAYYPLAADGAIHQWLACGPILSPIPNLELSARPDGSPFDDKGRWAINYWAWDERVRALKLDVYRHQ